PQLIQASFYAVIPAYGVSHAQLLIPKNPLRWSFLVANYRLRNLVLFSFDMPIGDPDGGDLGAGIPMGAYYQEANGSVSTNDIWVWCNDPAETYPFQVMGYQGQISLTGNRKRPGP